MIRRRGTIDNTNSILDAWIMVEHLSEGEININDEKVLLLNDLTDKKYKKNFQTRMKSSREYEYKNSGLVLYLDIFKFGEVVEFLRDKYGVAKTQSDINYGNKFSIALYFDKNINFISDNIFFTCSGYMRYLQDVPSKSDFQEFEEKFKEKTIKRFEGSEDDQEKFDNALNALLNEYNIDIKNCRVQILSNIETEATNLHSFFIEDLNKAKEIDNTNLKRYLTGGNIKDRINLDSKNDSPNYNQSVFEKILEPQNYPLGRFPSKTEFALSFMQQVAVNLTIGYDNSNMRSVNGPPGTGKTTLLKIINGLLEPDTGEVIYGSNVSVAYYDQEHQVLHMDKTLFDELSDTYPEMTNTQIRNILAAFLFTGEDVYKKIADLSGGERGRVSLVKLMLSKANFLLLDEPTNHLDIVSKDVLENALNNFPGTLCYVSHDRYFINKTATRILDLTENRLLNYIGNYDYYIEKREAVEEAANLTNTEQAEKPADVSESKKEWIDNKTALAQKKKVKNALNKCEKEISEIEDKLQAVDEEFANPENASNVGKLMELQKQKEALEKRLDKLMEDWEELTLQTEE